MAVLVQHILLEAVLNSPTYCQDTPCTLQKPVYRDPPATAADILKIVDWRIQTPSCISAAEAHLLRQAAAVPSPVMPAHTARLLLPPAALQACCCLPAPAGMATLQAGQGRCRTPQTARVSPPSNCSSKHLTACIWNLSTVSITLCSLPLIPVMCCPAQAAMQMPRAVNAQLKLQATPCL
jgi:hypothetical protein